MTSLEKLTDCFSINLVRNAFPKYEAINSVVRFSQDAGISRIVNCLFAAKMAPRSKDEQIRLKLDNMSQEIP